MIFRYFAVVVLSFFVVRYSMIQEYKEYMWKRSDFSDFDGHVYLDCAGRSPLPISVSNTGKNAISVKEVLALLEM